MPIAFLNAIPVFYWSLAMASLWYYRASVIRKYIGNESSIGLMMNALWDCLWRAVLTRDIPKTRVWYVSYTYFPVFAYLNFQGNECAASAKPRG
jgi:hypothetical protein